MTHRNAPLTVEGRRRLIERCQSRPIAHVAAEMGISRQCAAAPGQAGITDGGGQAGITDGGGQSGVTIEPTPPPATEAPAPTEPIYWVDPPAQHQKIDYQPLPNWDYDTNTYTPPAYTKTTPTPVDVVAPIIAPRDTLRIGTFHIAQPNWVSDVDLERTNNTTAIIESGAATGWNSFGVAVDKASRDAATQVGGAAAGALAGGIGLATPFAIGGALIGGTVGGNIGLGLGNVFVPGIGWVAGGLAGTAVGAGTGALLAGAPAFIVGGLGGGIAGFTAAVAYGAGELGEPVEIEVPDVDQPAVTSQTQDTLTDWENSGPIGEAVATTVRDTIATAPTIDQQAHDFVAAQPGGEQIVEHVDTALTDFLTSATPGLASSLISDAVGAGIPA
ncbi:leucine-zipper of insertion element IS481 [Rhodococcus erythropolis]|uniref:leucine zipper domain-containing protein n=1 Tax=Rhodococcus erythropolis TaxID=1833 RepID=UPI00087628E6|nr:leucine zipper domain-containing protein [Rhodococcus erythropolis]SCY76019.1 leucine-zipper of insertion element IS481 [Rhodococcus erythropolis]